MMDIVQNSENDVNEIKYQRLSIDNENVHENVNENEMFMKYLGGSMKRYRTKKEGL
jgi:hypothetical protein